MIEVVQSFSAEVARKWLHRRSCSFSQLLEISSSIHTGTGIDECAKRLGSCNIACGRDHGPQERIWERRSRMTIEPLYTVLYVTPMPSSLAMRSFPINCGMSLWRLVCSVAQLVVVIPFHRSCNASSHTILITWLDN